MTSVRERVGFMAGVVAAAIVFGVLTVGVPAQANGPDSLTRGGAAAHASGGHGAHGHNTNGEAGEQADATELLTSFDGPGGVWINSEP